MLQIKNPNIKIKQAIDILSQLGMPKAQLNPRSGLCLLALLQITPKGNFSQSQSPLIGITPIMDFCRDNYKLTYAPNSRETFRRFSIHQLVQAGIVLINPDDPARSTNSPKTVYQIAPDVLDLILLYKTSTWKQALTEFNKTHSSLTDTYAKTRKLNLIPVTLEGGELILSPGAHNELIKMIIELFAPRFLHDSVLVYVGDTSNKSAYHDDKLIKKLNIPFNEHTKLPDVVFYIPGNKWLILVESVTSHGPMDSKRYKELAELFVNVKVDIVYVTAFPNKTFMTKYFPAIAWETEVWIADNPDHMIHFNGAKFLGPFIKS